MKDFGRHGMCEGEGVGYDEDSGYYQVIYAADNDKEDLTLEELLSWWDPQSEPPTHLDLEAIRPAC